MLLRPGAIRSSGDRWPLIFRLKLPKEEKFFIFRGVNLFVQYNTTLTLYLNCCARKAALVHVATAVVAGLGKMSRIDKLITTIILRNISDAAGRWKSFHNCKEHF